MPFDLTRSSSGKATKSDAMCACAIGATDLLGSPSGFGPERCASPGIDIGGVCLRRWLRLCFAKPRLAGFGHDHAGRAGGYACPAHATRVGYGLRPVRDGFRNRGTGIPTVPSAPSLFVWVKD